MKERHCRFYYISTDGLVSYCFASFCIHSPFLAFYATVGMGYRLQNYATVVYEFKFMYAYSAYVHLDSKRSRYPVQVK